MNSGENTIDLLHPLDDANRRWGLTERGREQKARLRDTAIKNIAKRLSVTGADIASKRQERALIRASIYNAVIPAVTALDERRAVIERRQRYWLAATFTSTAVAVLAIVVMVTWQFSGA